MKLRAILAAVLLIGGAFFLYRFTQSESSIDFIELQAAQSALFPKLGPLLMAKSAQPAQLVFKSDSMGVMIRLKAPITDHAEREEYRNLLLAVAREWAAAEPKLAHLRVYVQFDDEK